MPTRVRTRPVSDTGPLEELFRDRYPAVVRIAFAMTGHSGLAEDLAQEAFVRTWKRWPDLEDHDRAYAYVRAAVVNLARSALRRRMVEVKHRGSLLARDVEHDPGLRIDLIRAMGELPARQRACVVLRYLEGLPERETAEALGISVGTVKSSTHRALRRLEAMLGGDSDG